MKAIRDLPRLRRAVTRGIRIETRAITADNFDFRMPLESVSRGSGRTIRQQLHHLTTLQIDDNRPESRALPPGPFIDAHDTDRGPVGLGCNAFLQTRRIVVSLTGMPRLAISRSEGRPPAPWPNSLTIPANRVVRRDNGVASLGSRSAKIWRSHYWFLHRQRVDCAWIITGLP